MSEEIYTCKKSYRAMNTNDPVISQPIPVLVNWVAEIEILIKLFLENVENIPQLSEITFFWSENKTPFYLFVSDPVSDPVSDLDSNPDPKCLFRIRIGSGSGQKLRIRYRIRNTENNA